MQNKVVVGKIIACHGIKGQVKLLSFCNPPESIFTFKNIFIDDKPFKMTKISTQKDRFIVSLENVISRNDAEMIKSKEISVLREEFPDLDDDEFYVNDLVGIDVFSKDNTHLGKINSVQNFGASDFLEVSFLNSKPELIEFTKDKFPIIDIQNKKIIIQ